MLVLDQTARGEKLGKKKKRLQARVRKAGTHRK